MREYGVLWKTLRIRLALLQNNTLERMVGGTKEDFDRRKGEWLAYDEVRRLMITLEEKDFQGTLIVSEEMEKELDNNG